MRKSHYKLSTDQREELQKRADDLRDGFSRLDALSDKAEREAVERIQSLKVEEEFKV